MEVKMYTTRWCGDCMRAKRFLSRQEVEFDEIDIEKVSGAVEDLVKWTGGKKTVPTFEIDGRILVNPPIADLAKALNKSV